MALIADPKSVVFAQSPAPVDLKTAKTLIKGRDHWLLIGEGWWQMGIHQCAIPDIDHPIEVVSVPHFPTPVLLTMVSVPPDQWLGVKVSRTVV